MKKLTGFALTCHTEYHQKLGAENLKNPDMVFHFYFYNKWLYGLLGLLILLAFWGACIRFFGCYYFQNLKEISVIL